MHFGATLQLLRTHAGLSLRTLGQRVGVSAAYLSRLEHGHDPAPTGERAVAIARALGVPPTLVLALVDELRGDAADWLRATPTGRRLAAELRRRELGEAQLARVLAFVQQEFPTAAEASAPGVRAVLDASRVLLGVRVPSLADAWALAGLRLGGDAAALVDALRRDAHGSTACVGDATAVSFVRGHTPARRACLVACEGALDVPTPDDRPVRVVWVLSGLDGGAASADLLAATARLADRGLVRALLGAVTPEQALTAIERFERNGTP